jgi:hypothetical protein
MPRYRISRATMLGNMKPFTFAIANSGQGYMLANLLFLFRLRAIIPVPV